MPWVVKALLVALRSKRGRKLLVAGAAGAFELARSPRARNAYARAWKLANERRTRLVTGANRRSP
jgi:hypothetical protein